MNSGVTILVDGKPFDLADDTSIQIAIAAKVGRESARIDDADLRDAYERLRSGVMFIAIKFGALTYLSAMFKEAPEQALLDSFSTHLHGLVGLNYTPAAPQQTANEPQIVTPPSAEGEEA